MKMAFIIFVSFIHILTSTGCTTMQPVNKDISQEGLKNLINPGDEIVIHTKPHEANIGDEYRVVVKAIMEEKIIVEDADFNEMVFYFSDIEAIEKVKFAPGKTIVAIVAIPVIAVLALIGLLLSGGELNF